MDFLWAPRINYATNLFLVVWFLLFIYIYFFWLIVSESERSIAVNLFLYYYLYVYMYVYVYLLRFNDRLRLPCFWRFSFVFFLQGNLVSLIASRKDEV